MLAQLEHLEEILLHIAQKEDTKLSIQVAYLRKNWDLIAGQVAALHSAPIALDKQGVLTVRTDSAAWSHNFLLLKKKILSKIQHSLLKEKGRPRLVIKDLFLQHGKVLPQDTGESEELPTDYVQTLWQGSTCSVCGKAIGKYWDKCLACTLQEAKQKRREIAQYLRDFPWLSNEELAKKLKCDIILCEDVRQKMLHEALTQALAQGAELSCETYAVLLMEQIQPDAIDEAYIAAKIASYRRMKGIYHRR